MKQRDAFILAAVLLVGGFALADALRGEDSPEPALEAQPETTEETDAPAVEVEVDADLGRESFPAVRGAGGSVVVAEAGSCAIREFNLATGLELANVVARSTCDLWAAPVTAKVAVGISAAEGDAVPFRFVDLAHPRRNLGTSEAAFGSLVWSEDGQRAAWCNARRVGIDLELGGGRRLLPDCPAAYTLQGEVAHARGERLVVGGRVVLEASGGITAARYGRDGSVAVVVDGRRIERYEGRELTHALDLPARFQGRLPVLSPDNCSAAFRAGENIRILDVGCSTLGAAGTLLPGHAVAWAPRSSWIAVGGSSELTFYDLAGFAEPVVWPVGVARIVWRRT